MKKSLRKIEENCAFWENGQNPREKRISSRDFKPRPRSGLQQKSKILARGHQKPRAKTISSIYNNDYIGCRSLFSPIPCIDEDIDTSNFTYSIKEHDFPIIVFSIGVDDSSQ